MDNPPVKRRRKSGGNYRAPAPGPSHVHTLSGLSEHYRNNPGSFSRLGPPTPRLPLKFTCRECRAEVASDAGSCAACGARFYWH